MSSHGLCASKNCRLSGNWKRTRIIIRRLENNTYEERLKTFSCLHWRKDQNKSMMTYETLGKQKNSHIHLPFPPPCSDIFKNLNEPGKQLSFLAIIQILWSVNTPSDWSAACLVIYLKPKSLKLNFLNCIWLCQSSRQTHFPNLSALTSTITGEWQLMSKTLS